MIVRSSEPRKFFAENEQNRPYANFNQVGYECKEHCERNDCEVSREARPGTAELILIANEFQSRKYRHAVDKNRTNHGEGTDEHWNPNRNSRNLLHPSVAKTGDSCGDLLPVRRRGETFAYHSCGLLCEVVSSSEISPKEAHLAIYIPLKQLISTLARKTAVNCD